MKFTVHKRGAPRLFMTHHTFKTSFKLSSLFFVVVVHLPNKVLFNAVARVAIGSTNDYYTARHNGVYSFLSRVSAIEQRLPVQRTA